MFEEAKRLHVARGADRTWKGPCWGSEKGFTARDVEV